MSQDNKRNFILHGSILAMAGIFVRIIGMVYRIPVLNIIGSEGNGIYVTAYNVYNIILVLSSYGLPMAVSKLISARFTKRRYKNAAKVLRCSLTVGAFTGGVAALLVYFGADFIENEAPKNTRSAAIPPVYGGGVPGLAIPLRVLAPTIFIVALLGVLRGFFQGQGTMIPTAVSQIIEQLVNAGVSIAAGYMLMKAYSSASNASAYGAAGSTLGTAMGALTALVFFIFLYLIYRPTFMRMVAKDKSVTRQDTNRYIYKTIIITMVPIILSQTFYQISALIDDVMFSNIMMTRNISKNISMDLGNFGSSYTLLISIPQGIATALSASMLPSIVASYTEDDYDSIYSKITKTLKTNMFIAVPSFVGFFVIGEPIIKLLFSRYDSVQGGLMLKIGAIAIVFYTLSTVTSSALQAVDRVKTPMINSFISLVVHIILVLVLLEFTNLGIFSLVIGNASFPVIIFVLNLIALYRDEGYRLPVISIFAKPVICSALMGICTLLTYNIINNITMSNTISVLVALCVAAITYFGPYVLLMKKFKDVF